MCFEVETQEVRYVWVISALKSKEKDTAEVLGDFKATSNVRLILEAKGQQETHGWRF